MAFKGKIKDIELLIEKYYDAQTTLEEENLLRDFFTNEEVPAHLMFEKAQFAFYEEEKYLSNDKEIELPEVSIKSNRKSIIMKYMNYAAAAAILISAGWFSNLKYQDHLQEQKEVRLAYKETQKALKLLAGNFKVGIDKAKTLKEMNRTQKQIIENKY